MKKERFFELLGNIDENTIKEAERAPKNRTKLIITALAAAACVGLMIGAGYMFTQRSEGVQNDSTADTTQSSEDSMPDDSEDALATEQGDVNIYYVKDGKIQSTVEFLEMSPEKVFDMWKSYNDIGDEIRLISVKIDSNGTETADSDVAQYTAGDKFIMTVTVSAELESQLTDDPLLEQSLEKTMTSYGDPNLKYDEFTLVFD